MSKDPPSSWWGRSAKLAALGAGLARREIGAKVSQALQRLEENSPDFVAREVRRRVEEARLLTQGLGQLKGAAMKLGQLMSLELQDYLPPEAVKILSELQDQAPSLSWERVREVLEGELGPERLASLERLDQNALASASIGQVHRARYQGREIVLKVQYPGVAESIPTDLKMLRNLAQWLLRLSGRDVSLDALMQELGEVLQRETDYVAEAEALRRYKKLFAGDERFVLPDVIAELSTQRVLALSFEEGVKVRDFAGGATQSERNHFAKLGLDLYFKEFFELGVVQTDPNFGNFLLRPQTGQLVLLDFGATRDYEAAFRREYVALLRSVQARSPAAAKAQALRMQLLDARESEACFAEFYEVMRVSLEPFEPARQPYDYADTEYAKRVSAQMLKFQKAIRYSAPPHQLIFLHRKLGGVFQWAKTLKGRVDLLPYWQQILVGLPGLEPGNVRIKI